MFKRLILLLILSAVIYFPGLAGEFLYWDDSTHIINNASLVAGAWTKFWTEPYYGLYIPVIYSVWTLVWRIGHDPTTFHIFNLLLHALNGAMVFRLLQMSLSETRSTKWVVWIGTLAWMFHPLQNEPAVWISGARDLLAASFGLGALLALLEREGWKSQVESTAMFVLGLLSKATLAPIPVAILALATFRRRILPSRSRQITLCVWLVAAVCILYVNKLVQQENTEAMVDPVPLAQRFIIAADTLGFYVQKIFVPYPIAPDYGRIPELVLAQKWWIWPSIFFAVALVAVIGARRIGLIAVFEGWIFFGLVLGPVLGIIPFMAQAQSSTADRYVYLALFGPALGLCEMLLRWPILKKISVALLAVWAALNFSHSAIYKDSDTFFTYMLDYNPESFVAHTTIGVVKFQKNQMDQAEDHFRHAMRIKPLLVSPAGNLAVLLWQQKRFDRITTDIEPLFANPDYIKANLTTKPSLSRMGRIVARVQKMQMRLADANRTWCRSFELDPESQDGVQEFLAVQNSTGLTCEAIKK